MMSQDFVGAIVLKYLIINIFIRSVCGKHGGSSRVIRIEKLMIGKSNKFYYDCLMFSESRLEIIRYFAT